MLSAPPGPGGIIRLYEKDYHYLVNVRRLGAGSSFAATLPGGAETLIRVLSTVDGILIGQCEGISADGPPEGRGSIPPIALFQGLPRGAKMDLIVRQAAEGGVSIIAPFESEYSTARLKMDSGTANAAKVKRWERIIREARQQSGSVTETQLRMPVGFNSILDYWESLKKQYRRPKGILFHQEPLEKGSIHEYLGDSPDFAALAVGPEGGFSPREVSLLTTAGFRPFLLGDTVLRTETAALYGTAAIRIILLESESWIPRPAE